MALLTLPELAQPKKKVGRGRKDSSEDSKPKLSVFDSDHETTDDEREGSEAKKKSAKKSGGGKVATKKVVSKKKQKLKKKKGLKDEFNMEMRDMIVKKRIASLNASAIMSASYVTSPTDAKDAEISTLR